MTQRGVYVRCNGGDYFEAQLGACPLDGWSSPEAAEVAEVCRRLVQDGEDLSVARLRAAGVCEAALSRVIVVDFGAEEATFELLAPRGYILDGQWTPWADAPRALK